MTTETNSAIQHETDSAVQHLAPRAKTAGLLSAVGAAMALIALAYSSWQLNRTRLAIGTARAELQSLERRKSETLRALERLQAASQTQQTALANVKQHAAQGGRLPNELVNQVQQALVSGERANADAAAVVPVVGILTVAEWQQPVALKLADQLRGKGFQIRVVRPVHEGATVPDTTEVRYYRTRNDPGDAAQLRDILRAEFGLQNARILPAGDRDSPPNKYEIWLDKSAFSNPPQAQ